ncbi:hypothetical protein K431DRAFT_286425 [Polychaeton citri CBS 116435]|uniref:PQ-loop-domain-containing protein n=1 Tax=Polychaeton citri CBS 116435 TaxID=1314669 RepID=A0A9P4UL57_9PEZI|nr:hypothetical protein K431DRAFT_286425 [Polychaeton citri CBS 116435]
MQWLAAANLEPSLPAHCEPANDFLLRFSRTFHVCLPTPLAFISTFLGVLSIVSWLFAQLPQIYKNYNIKSTSGLSIYFLVEWCLGDLGNLLGALFTHQATWQVTIGGYYVFVDLCLVGQWIWYEKLRHGRLVRRIYRNHKGGPDSPDSGSLDRVIVEGVDPNPEHGQMDDEVRGNRSQPKIIFRQPTYQSDTLSDKEKQSPSAGSTPSTPRRNIIHRVGAPGSSFPTPSPRTVLMIACLIAMAQARPTEQLHRTDMFDSHATPLEKAGTVLSWMSTFLYLGSRLPQLYKNWKRKSTSGLSPHLFLAAFFGNLFYSCALLTNPCAWNDFGPYGGSGWADKHGSDRVTWVAAALPFFLGAAGVLGLDASVGLQFVLYGDGDAKVIVIEGKQGSKWRWRKITGWMRGWMPSISEASAGEREALLEHDGRTTQRGEGYGAL